jgi:gas vesicle protein
MGYIRGLTHGALLGVVVGLCVAPQPGERTRAQLKEAGKGVKAGLEITTRAVQKMAPVVAPMAGSAIQVAARARHRGEHAEHEHPVGANGSLDSS